MPGRFFLTSSGTRIADAFGASGAPMVSPRWNVSPGQEILVFGLNGFEMMRWGMLPVGRTNARGRPVMETIINARSETVFDKSAFVGVGRAVVPADGWYEWTGETRRKTAWRITPISGDLLFFAAITDVWKVPGGTAVSQVATVTCAPSADVRDIHHRMGVLLTADQVPTWLNGSLEVATRMMTPFPDGSLHVSEAKDIDWTGP